MYNFVIYISIAIVAAAIATFATLAAQRRMAKTRAKQILSDAEREARASKDSPYVSHLHKMLMASKLNVITRPVEKGKKYVPFFALNEKERQADNDGFWHDVYGLTNVRPNKIAEALDFAVATNKANASANSNSEKQSAYDALMAAIKQNSANAAVANALA